MIQPFSLAPLTDDGLGGYRRVSYAVFRSLKAHPLLRGLPGSVGLSHHLSAVWGTYHSGAMLVEARVEANRWWEPATDAHIAEVADRIAALLRARIDAARSTGADRLSPAHRVPLHKTQIA